MVEEYPLMRDKGKVYCFDGWMSGVIQSEESNGFSTEKELLAIVWSICELSTPFTSPQNPLSAIVCRKTLK